MFVGAQIVNPKLVCPRFLGCGFAVEKGDVGLDPLSIPNPRRQTEQCVNIGLLEQLSADGLAGAAFKENVVGNDDRGAAVLLQDGKDVLEEVELFVAVATNLVLHENTRSYSIHLGNRQLHR